MSDFASFGDSQEEYNAVRQLNVQLVRLLSLPTIILPELVAAPNTNCLFLQEAEPDNFELWEKLIKACEGLEGGLNRNSSPQALATYRDAYDRFLLKFPLLFGYWKKYADSEFVIAGPESAEMV
jgi:pre-mRNA-processing factor 39